MGSLPVHEADRSNSWNRPSFDLDRTSTGQFNMIGLEFPQVAQDDYSNPGFFEQQGFPQYDAEMMSAFLTSVASQRNARSSCPSSSGFRESAASSIATPAFGAQQEGKATSDTDSSLPELFTDVSGERRRAQNRAAQRAHRDRQKRYVTQLEKRYLALQASYNQLDEKYQTVQKEYESLVNVVETQRTPSSSPLQRTIVEPVSIRAPADFNSPNEFSLCEQELDRVLAFKAEDVAPPGQRAR